MTAVVEIVPMPRNLRLDGSDPDYIYTSMDSFTDPGARYDQRISRRTGEACCSCPDSQCRKKRGDLIRWDRDGKMGGCKHLQSLAAEMDAAIAVLDLQTEPA